MSTPPVIDRTTLEALHTEMTEVRDSAIAAIEATFNPILDGISRVLDRMDLSGAVEQQLSGDEQVKKTEVVRQQFDAVRESVNEALDKCIGPVFSRVSAALKRSGLSVEDPSLGKELSSFAKSMKIAKIPIYNLSILPDLPILDIFNQLPVTDLLSNINIVCTRFAALQPKALAQRRALTILVNAEGFFYFSKRQITKSFFKPPYDLLNDDGTPMHVRSSVGTEADLNRLKLRHLSTKRAKEIFDRFPRVTSLVISLEHNELLGLIALLLFYSDSLVSLKLFVAYLYPAVENPNGRAKYDERKERERFNNQLLVLLDAINELKALKNLTIDFCVNRGRNEATFHLPILSQLEQFYICSNYTPQLVNAFKRYAEPNHGLKSVGFFIDYLDDEKLAPFLQLDRQLTSKFTYASYCATLHLWPQFCHQFCNLSTLYLLTDDVTADHIFKLFPALASLKQLVKLDIFELGDPNAANNPPFPANQSVPSVKALTFFNVDKRGHNAAKSDLEYFRFYQLFPSVQVITIKNVDYCYVCHWVDDITQRDHITEEEKRCDGRQLVPLLQCAALRLIKMNPGIDEFEYSLTREELEQMEWNEEEEDETESKTETETESERKTK